MRRQLGKAAQVLNRRCQREFISCPGKPAQTQSVDLEDAFEMRTAPRPSCARDVIVGTAPWR